MDTLCYCCNRLSVATNIEISGLHVRIQDGNEENSATSAAKIKGNFSAVLDHTENKLM